MGHIYFLSSTASRPPLLPAQPRIQWVNWALSVWLEGREVKLTTHHHSGGGAFTSYALSRCGASVIKHRDNIIVPLPKYILQCFGYSYINVTLNVPVIYTDLKELAIYLKLRMLRLFNIHYV
jgi:hypothetical protein